MDDQLVIVLANGAEHTVKEASEDFYEDACKKFDTREGVISFVDADSLASKRVAVSEIVSIDRRPVPDGGSWYFG